MLLTSLIFAELVELYTVQGERPPAIFRHGRRSCVATCRIILGACGFLVRLLFFHCMPAGLHSDSTPDSRRVRL